MSPASPPPTRSRAATLLLLLGSTAAMGAAVTMGCWLGADSPPQESDERTSAQGQPSATTTATATASAGPQLTPIAPRGSLMPEEVRTIETFRNASPAVVYITKLAVRTDRYGTAVHAP